MEITSKLKYKIQGPRETAYNVWRVHWKAGKLLAGYEDFTTHEAAEEYVKELHAKYVTK